MAMGILDTMLEAKREDLSQSFAPLDLAEKILGLLKERDRKIVSKRHGVLQNEKSTLDSIGRELNLTRERVRQIEKNLIAELRKQVKTLEDFQKHSDHIQGVISKRGGLVAEVDLLESLGVRAVAEANVIRFILILMEGVEEIRESKHVKNSWKLLGFDEKVLTEFLGAVYGVLEGRGKPHKTEHLLELVKETESYKKHAENLLDSVMRNFLSASLHLDKNPLGEFGLNHWPEIKPRDVGDKAYLALKSHGKPVHYAEITEIINKLGFSGRKAHPETVHNELIKDDRFVLIGRGIYALSEWGYRSGVVADVITEVLSENNGGPLNREELIKEVMKRRQVKRNTIMVSLSNKELFKKVGKDAFQLVSK